jgi:hypothetical protein
MGNKIFLKAVLIIFLFIIILPVALYCIKIIHEPEFKINIIPDTEIFFSEYRKEYYIIDAGEEIYINITRDNYPTVINEFSMNNKRTIAFSIDSFMYSKYTIVAHHVVFVSPDNKIKTRRIHGIIDGMEWLDDKTLKLKIYHVKNGESIKYLRDPFNISIFEKSWRKERN